MLTTEPSLWLTVRYLLCFPHQTNGYPVHGHTDQPSECVRTLPASSSLGDHRLSLTVGPRDQTLS